MNRLFKKKEKQDTSNSLLGPGPQGVSKPPVAISGPIVVGEEGLMAILCFKGRNRTLFLPALI